jgi:hypothetical protein
MASPTVASWRGIKVRSRRGNSMSDGIEELLPGTGRVLRSVEVQLVRN